MNSVDHKKETLLTSFGITEGMLTKILNVLHKSDKFDSKIKKLKQYKIKNL